MNTNTIEIPVKPKRRFLPDDLKIDAWEKIERYFTDLRDRKITSVKDLENWLLDWSELEAVLSEDAAWRYIHMTCDTANQQYVDAYNFYITEIDPRTSPFNNEFNKKLIASPYLDQLDKEKYRIFLRSVKKAVEIYREENIPLFTEQNTESQKFGAISGDQTIHYNGQELTMQRGASLLKETDRNVRETVWKLMQERREKDVNTLNDLFTRLIRLRHQIALNAGFSNYRDYKFAALGRFDYGVQDCFNFHDSILNEIVPLNVESDKARKKALGLDVLRPWDADVDISGKQPLKPFNDSRELIERSVKCFYKVRPYFGECLETMNAMKHLDLDSRKGKAPGGYNYPLYEIGVPFIFMNSVGTHRDLVTMVHEGGHAVHSFLSRNLEITEFKSLPSEVAELASMGMELISMEHWDVFFTDAAELKRAKKEQLEKILHTLPWIATIDKFQHWVYENPEHSTDQRAEAWTRIIREFHGSVVDWTGYEQYLRHVWQRQMHLFEVPFYYIEYGFAQLGAVAVWRNYKKDPEKALDQYQAALSLGYTKSIPEIYQAAGIKFDFSRAYVKELVDFIKSELEQLN
jgi:oligoendopeptidase F